MLSEVVPTISGLPLIAEGAGNGMIESPTRVSVPGIGPSMFPVVVASLMIDGLKLTPFNMLVLSSRLGIPVVDTSPLILPVLDSMS